MRDDELHLLSILPSSDDSTNEKIRTTRIAITRLWLVPCA